MGAEGAHLACSGGDDFGEFLAARSGHNMGGCHGQVRTQ